jgi:hypothetical protein
VQFFAETFVTSSTGGVIENEQHDMIWVDAIAKKAKTVTVDDIFGTNITTIYRGDLKKEYYITDDMKCYYTFAPPDMNIKIKIQDNATFDGMTTLNGVSVQVWVYVAVNQVTTYYITNENKPVKVELVSGKHIDVIDFRRFDIMVPDKMVFELKSGMHCEEMNIGVKNPTRKDVEKYFSAVPMLIKSKENTHRIRPSLPKVEGAIDPATLALIGKTLWAIIKENKPEANLESNINAVIPQGTTWTDMSGWRQQKWPGWQWSLVNVYGVTTVDYRWAFNFLCNGNYKNIGKYIENAGAFPTMIDVSWGYKVNVKGQVLNPFNYGTSTNPVAGLTLSMTMDVNTLVKKITQTCTVNLIGDCSTEVVSCNGYKSSSTFSYFH